MGMRSHLNHFYAKKIFGDLGFPYRKIDACSSDLENLTQYKTCETFRWRTVEVCWKTIKKTLKLLQAITLFSIEAGTSKIVYNERNSRYAVAR